MSKVHILKSKYEAGQPSPYRENPPYSRSIDSEIAIGGRQLRDWARHLADNSSIVVAVSKARVRNGIGKGLSYEPLVKDRKGKLIPEINDKIRKIHTDWSKRPDVTGELTRQEIERLVWKTWDIDGECFIRRVVRRNKNVIPYQLQVLDTDWVPMLLSQDRDNKRIIHGIEKDEWGEPLRYYIEANQFDVYSTPGVTLNPEKMIQIPAEDMWHIKHVVRPNQTRGVTILHPVIFRIADVATFVESHNLAAAASADLFAAINRSADMAVDQSDTEKRTWNFEHLQMLDELQPGESVTFNKPEHPNTNAVDFVREQLRSIASATGVGFSQIAQVFDSSYAAQRLEVVDTWRATWEDRDQFIGDFAREALYERPVQMAVMSGLLPARAMRRVDPDTLYDVRIDGPTMPVIDPVKDRQAYEMDQLNKWESRHGIQRLLGKIPQEVDSEIEDDSLRMESESIEPPNGENEDAIRTESES